MLATRRCCMLRLAAGAAAALGTMLLLPVRHSQQPVIDTEHRPLSAVFILCLKTTLYRQEGL
jgi:hypothetical protein